MLDEEKIIRAQVKNLDEMTDHLLDRMLELEVGSNERREVLRLLHQTVGRAKTKRRSLRALTALSHASAAPTPRAR
jgi:hypothetical protein